MMGNNVKRRPELYLILSVILTAITLFVQTAAATELKIGLIPEQNVFEQVKRYRAIGMYIEKKTGTKIVFTILPKYGNIIESFKNKKIDGAFWGSFTGAMAIRQLDIQPLVRPVKLNGQSSYRGYIFVHKYSVIDSVERMKGASIAFVDRATTAGYVFPLAYFRESGVTDIDSYFKEYMFTGSHDSSIYAVIERKADVGCAKDTIFDMLAAGDPRVKEDLVVLAVSREVPSNGLGIRKDIPLAVREDIKRVLLGMDKDHEGMNILKKFGAKRFIETTTDDYSPVFDIAAGADINPAQYSYWNK